MNSILGDLSVLDLDSNKISGSLSASISALSSLQVLLVHNNLMSGSCPSFALLKALEILTLFNNRFNGRLVLPTDATLDALLVHSNRYIPSPALLCALCFARSLLRLKHQLSSHALSISSHTFEPYWCLPQSSHRITCDHILTPNLNAGSYSVLPPPDGRNDGSYSVTIPMQFHLALSPSNI